MKYPQQEIDLKIYLTQMFYEALNDDDTFRRDLHELFQSVSSELTWSDFPPASLGDQLNTFIQKWCLPKNEGELDLWDSLRDQVMVPLDLTRHAEPTSEDRPDSPEWIAALTELADVWREARRGPLRLRIGERALPELPPVGHLVEQWAGSPIDPVTKAPLHPVTWSWRVPIIYPLLPVPFPFQPGWDTAAELQHRAERIAKEVEQSIVQQARWLEEAARSLGWHGDALPPQYRDKETVRRVMARLVRAIKGERWPHIASDDTASPEAVIKSVKDMARRIGIKLPPRSPGRPRRN